MHTPQPAKRAADALLYQNAREGRRYNRTLPHHHAVDPLAASTNTATAVVAACWGPRDRLTAAQRLVCQHVAPNGVRHVAARVPPINVRAPHQREAIVQPRVEQISRPRRRFAAAADGAVLSAEGGDAVPREEHPRTDVYGSVKAGLNGEGRWGVWK